MPGFLLLHLEAPLMAFGGPVVDANGPTRLFPGQAQVTGLLGNALGLRHGDTQALDALQARLRLAAAVLRLGELVRDYQTVDLGQPYLDGTGWTTRGHAEMRDGASSRDTHIRTRWFLADGCVLVAATLAPADEQPRLEELQAALSHPARPLFIGRKPCLPTAPVLLAIVQADVASEALRQGAQRLGHTGPMRVEQDERLSGHPIESHGEGTDWLVDGRDWRNQIHTGARAVRRYTLHLGPDARAGVEP